METEADVVDRLRYLYTVLAFPVDYDVFCYMPTEWDQIQHKPFWRHARRSESSFMREDSLEEGARWLHG
jgi:hypothetical protein